MFHGNGKEFQRAGLAHFFAARRTFFHDSGDTSIRRHFNNMSKSEFELSVSVARNRNLHSSHGGEFGERIDSVKDASHILQVRYTGLA
jgi:hypothetical protein